MIRSALAILAALVSLGCSRAEPDLLLLDSGPVLREASGVYKGIPYAAPPVGELRWRPPAAPAPWTEPRRFDAFGPVCPQQAPDGPAEEGCLTLNIWTPARKPGAKMAVMFFLHGGAFVAGAGSQDLYDGAALAGEGVVVVTCNYRLGTLGFLAHPLLSAESPDGVSGNYGLQDQLAALAWVKRNIAAFGGDPEQVSVFGQSAGGESIALLLICPEADGLFNRAIMQSPAMPGSLRHLREPRLGVVPAEAVGQRIAALLGVDKEAAPLAALRRAAPADLERAARSLSAELGVELVGLVTGPVVDGKYIPEHPMALFKAGRFLRLPLIVGVTANEGSIFVPLLGELAEEPEAFRVGMDRLFGSDADEAIRLMQSRGLSEPWSGLDAALSARWFESFARFLARTAAENGVPSFYYRYTRPIPESAVEILAEDSGAGDLPLARFGVPHGAELFPVFGLTAWYLGFSTKDNEQGKATRGYWTRFAKNGEPGGDGAHAWPRFDPERPRAMEFGESIRQIDLLADPLLQLIERGWLTRTY